MTDYGPQCHPNGITGYGNTAAGGIVIVGIAPGREEVTARRPFIGPSGKLLDACLEGLGTPRESVYCTNLVCTQCKTPTRDQIAACGGRLRRELAALQPWIIILCGALVVETFLPERKISEVRGAAIWQETDWGGCYLLATYHPAGVMHGYVPLIHDIVRDLEKLPRMLTWPRDGSNVQHNVIVLRNAAQAQWALGQLPRDRPVAIDIETAASEQKKEVDPEVTGGEGDAEEFDVTSERLLSVAFSDGIKDAYVMDAFVAKSLWWPLDVQWTGHNAQFDMMGMRRFLNAPLPIVHDTMLASYCLDERGGKHSLKGLAREYLGAGFYEENIDRARLEDYPIDEVMTYNAADAFMTAKLINVLLPMLKKDEVEKPYYEIMIPAANAFTDIALRGIAVDNVRIRELQSIWFPIYVQKADELIKLGKELGFVNPSAKRLKPRSSKGVPQDNFDYAPHPDAINLQSAKQVTHLLYDVLELPKPEGRRSSDRRALELLEGSHPFVDKLLDFRRLDKVMGDYLMREALRMQIRDDSRMHPNILMHGTRTGRLSYRSPPLQTIPQSHKVGVDLARVREIFVPVDQQNYVVVGADYEKAEVHVAAYLSGDAQMIADLQGGDYHQNVAATAFNKRFEDVTESERQTAKNITFGILYGSGAAGLAQTMRCAVSTATEYIERFKERYHVYNEWYEKQRHDAQVIGELQGPNGRKRRFLLVHGDEAQHMLNQAVNSPVQSLASDYCLSSLIELHQHTMHDEDWRDAFFVWFSLHDANYFEVRRDRLADVIPLIIDVMQRPRFGLPRIPVEVKIGPNLGELKKWKPGTSLPSTPAFTAVSPSPTAGKTV